MKRMVLIPEEKLLQYERQERKGEGAQSQRYGLGERDEKEERRELSDDTIVRGIPKTMRARAIALLERLKARPDVISWDDMGQVKIEGVLIPKSNISDLVSGAMRSRKYFDPVGSQEFFNVLSNINVPKDLVRNEEGWRKVTQKGEGWADQRLLQSTPITPHPEKSWGGFTSLHGEGQGKRRKQKQKGGNQRLLPFTPVISYPEEWYKIRRRGLQKGKGKIFSDDFWKRVLEAKRLMRTTAQAGIYKGGGQKGGLGNVIKDKSVCK